MIPFVKLYIRRFHVTSKVFLRKIAPKTSSVDHKHEFSEIEVNVTSSCQNSNSDYLGIESDENVIIVKPQKYQFQQPQKSVSKEIFYRASFGIVRLDTENKLKYHGQYKRKRDFSFPHSSSEFVQVKNISQAPLYKNEIVQCLSLKDSQAVSAVDTLDTETIEPSLFEEKDHNISYIDESYFGTSEISDLAQDKLKQTAPKELNIPEKNYFETLDHSRSNKNQSEELNYLEKEFFGTLNKSENFHEDQDCSEHSNSKKFDSNLSNNNEELNYLEKSYFGDFSISENHPMNQNISNCMDNELKVNSTLDTKDQNIFSKKNKLSTAVDESTVLNKSLYENCSLSNDQNSINYDNPLMSSLHFEEINKDIYNNLNEVNPDDETNPPNKVPVFKFNDNVVHEFQKISQQQVHEVDFNKTCYNTQNSCTISDENTEPYIKNSNKFEELCNDTVKSFSKENNFKFSKLNSEEPKQDNDIPTAYDYVKKLRQEQNDNISKGKRTNKEQFDSKGFRILKHQVPNLSHFTRDEILNILKQNIVYSDDDLLVLNKPYSLVIHESQTTKEPCLSTFLDDLAKELDKQSRNPKLFTVHRLDKETTGCLLLARNETMAMHLKALFVQRKIVKKYWIITAGVPDPLEGVIDIPISEGSIDNRKRMVLHPKLPSDVLYKNHSKNGKPAVTTYKVIAEHGNAALVEVFPKTGVKHQIRVHFGFGLGCPVLGDHKYSHLDKLVPQTLPSDMLQRLQVRQSKVRHIPMHIHAKSVGIPEYFDKRDLFVNIPIPNHFKLNLKSLKFRKKDMTY